MRYLRKNILVSRIRSRYLETRLQLSRLSGTSPPYKWKIVCCKQVRVVPMLFTARNSSCGKVIFSQACVGHSIHGRGSSLVGGAVPGGMAEQGTPPWWQRMAPPLPGWQRTAPPYGQQAGGMHPTWMLSCLILPLLQRSVIIASYAYSNSTAVFTKTRDSRLHGFDWYNSCGRQNSLKLWIGERSLKIVPAIDRISLWISGLNGARVL